LQFDRLGALLEDYIQAYKGVEHAVHAIYIGLPVSHNDFSAVPIWYIRTPAAVHSSSYSLLVILM